MIKHSSYQCYIMEDTAFNITSIVKGCIYQGDTESSILPILGNIIVYVSI